MARQFPSDFSVFAKSAQHKNTSKRTAKKTSRPLAGSFSIFPNRHWPLIDHVGRRFQMLVDRNVAFPLIDKPVAHAELETELLHVPIEWVEVLVV